jgi:hypothetical protein
LGAAAVGRNTVTQQVHALDRELAKRSPDTVIGGPSAVREEVLLTYGEKLAPLERWRLGVLSELSAASEGMATQGASVPLLQLLDEIKEVNEALRVKRQAKQTG